jgi:hypothetical protein
MHKIIIEIKPGGDMTSEVENAPGKKCESVSRWLDRLGRVVSHRPTAEASQRASLKNSQKQKRG